jgi:hypothetical protein
MILLCCFAAVSTGQATVLQATPLSERAQISLLTCSPADDAVYALYGHTALRVYDPDAEIDWVFNYGIFDFSRPYFIYRFAKGETDYMVRAYHFSHYLMEYVQRGSEVYEQVLGLLPEEKERLWQALVFNERPENRIYRYNFFFDNCATRPAAIIESHIGGMIEYPPQVEQTTFRQAINFCTRNHPWVTFGCDLVLGAPTDRTMTLKESFFLPAYLKEAFDRAEIVRHGVMRPLVIKSHALSAETRTPEESPLFLTSPLVCFTLVFLIIAWLTWQERRKKTCFGWVDVTLFFIAGIAGCILFFLSFISVHPCIFPNISLLWLHPFHLAGALLFSAKKFNRPALFYHCINFAAILEMLIAWIFITQHFNIAFIPLIASLWLRSGWALIKKKAI